MKIKLQMILEKSADNDDDYSCWSNKARKKAKKKKIGLTVHKEYQHLFIWTTYYLA